jgi:exodeoxyribonuclease V alpha subunit
MMMAMTPLGAALERFRAETKPPAARDEPKTAAVDADDFEPAYLGWELARCAPGLPPDEQRALASLGAACIASMLAGSTRLQVQGAPFAASMAAVGAADILGSAERLLQRARLSGKNDPVSAVIGLAGERKPLILEGDWLYSERMLALEERFCARIRRRVARVHSTKETRAIARVVAAVASGPPVLTDEQKHALREALRAGLALITGGPGTGKTMTVVALVRALSWMGVPMASVAIAAPTGKAAQRLSEALAAGLSSGGADMSQAALHALAPTPLTLHRLLGWSPSSGRFARHENDPLPHRVVVVDEASMIDLAMMDRLVRALGDDARLVLLGDADQLPSVEAGAVFRDLCAAVGSARLATNLRVARDAHGRGIVAAAKAVNAGVLGSTAEPRRAVGELRFEGVEHLDVRWSDAGEAFLERWWRTRVATDAAFTRRAARTYRLRAGVFDAEDRDELLALFVHYSRGRILCATRVHGSPASADAINESLMVRLRGAAPSRRSWRRAADFAAGAPVIVQRNDYSRGLFNGDQGLVVRVDAQEADGPRMMAVFVRGGALEAFPVDDSADLGPAFAMTVHKAQGSEFEHVCLVLPDSDASLGALLTRELVYTAITRAQKSVVLVGPGELVARAVSRVTERHSGVAERLAGLS